MGSFCTFTCFLRAWHLWTQCTVTKRTGIQQYGCKDQHGGIKATYNVATRTLWCVPRFNNGTHPISRVDVPACCARQWRGNRCTNACEDKRYGGRKNMIYSVCSVQQQNDLHPYLLVGYILGQNSWTFVICLLCPSSGSASSEGLGLCGLRRRVLQRPC